MPDTPNNKQAWLKRISGSAIPSLSNNIKALSSAENYANKHSSELARSILKDPNLTASVLKLANSAHFNTHGQVIRTISRAVMVLGHKSIKEVCASCLLLESFASKEASANLQSILIRAFHSAVQAKTIASMQGQKSTEEIFISALLMNLGEASVYSIVESESAIYARLLESYPLTAGSEREILGCYFSDLTLGLCETWGIAPMIGQVLHGRYAEDSPIRSVLLGSSIASNCELVGFQQASDKHVKSIALYTGQKPEFVAEKILEATEETQKSLIRMGLALDVKLPVRVAATTETEVTIKIDKALQLEVIQELSFMIEECIDINEILLQVLEGIQRGGGFCNALVSLLSLDKTRLIAKHAIEGKDGLVAEDFDFSCYHDIPELKNKVMTNRNVLLQSSLREKGNTRKQIFKRTKVTNAVWGPLIVENKVIGCFYADNGQNGPPVNIEQLETFRLFVCQTKLFLHKLSCLSSSLKT